jgi:hypothetical protein
MARLQRRAIQMKLPNDSRTFAMIPAIRQQDPAYVEEDHVEGEHRRLSEN